jgi:hypothetical protein
MTSSFGSITDTASDFVLNVRNQEPDPAAAGQLPPGEQSSQFST